MKPPLRIAVLECDTPPPNAHARYNGYGGLFTELLHSGATYLAQHSKSPPPTAKVELSISSHDIVNNPSPSSYPDLDSIDAILLTGSKHNAFDDAPWILELVSYVRTVLAQSRVRIIGVCFGHQIVARALNTPVARSTIGWEVAVVPIPLTAAGAEVLGLQETNTLRIQQMHRDIVLSLPEGTISLGATERCEVQGFYAPGRLICVQGHPEFTAAIEEEILGMRIKQGLFTQEEYDDGMSRTRNEHDGVAVAAAFIRFLLDDGLQVNGSK